MTSIRRPNRRHIRGLADLVNGCPTTGKIRYLDQRTAEQARDQLARHDPDAARLETYRHASCGDWHVGHNPRAAR